MNKKQKINKCALQVYTYMVLYRCKKKEVNKMMTNLQKLCIKDLLNNITVEEKKIIDKTIKELNDLSNVRKRKKIIAQIDNE